jgi:hypothetical protein
MWKQDPPSDKQINYLRGLGHRGLIPQTKGEAAALIDQYKGPKKLRWPKKKVKKARVKVYKPRPTVGGVVCRTFRRTKPVMTEAEIVDAAAAYFQNPDPDCPF